MNNVEDIANMYQQAKEEISKLEQQLKEANKLLKKLNDKQVIKYKEINDYFEKYLLTIKK